MFKWREKRHGLWPFGCKHNSNVFYDVKFQYAECVKPLNAIPSNELYLILIERGCFTFTVTALVHSLESSCISLKGLDTFDSNTYWGSNAPPHPGKVQVSHSRKGLFGQIPLLLGHGRQSNVFGLPGRGGC